MTKASQNVARVAGSGAVEAILHDLRQPYGLIELDTPQAALEAKERLATQLEEVKELLSVAPEGGVDLPKVFGLLTTIMVEAGQYRHETYTRCNTAEDRNRCDQILRHMAELRTLTITPLQLLFGRVEFGELRGDLAREIVPLIQACNDGRRFLPFRVTLAGRFADRLLTFTDRTRSPELKELLSSCFDMKYPRFGTSGIRALWGKDFTEVKAKRVTQAVCDYATDQGLAGKPMVVGYDSRRFAGDKAARWVAEVCVANGFPVHFAKRDTPTPTLIYWGVEKLGANKIAAILNCTASHNPVEWHGIKYSQPNGCPAPTALTDRIGAQANLLQLEGRTFPPHEQVKEKWEEWKASGQVAEFEPLGEYCDWLLHRGINSEAIRKHFSGSKIIIDEMFGAGREYVRGLLDRIGVRYETLHEKDPNFGDVKYANPEPPYLNECIDRVRERGAMLGLSMDADADRYGIVDRGGTYFRPNQVLPLLVDYLVRDKGYTGKVVRTESTARAVDAVTGRLVKDPRYADKIIAPDPNEVPPYITHAFYQVRIGNPKDYFCGLPVYAVYVGIKYIAEIMEKDPAFRDAIIIGGEESSGLTTKGHLPDKDGPWACLLATEMVAVRKKSLVELWREFTNTCGPSCSGRVDIGAPDEVKERLLDAYLAKTAGAQIEGLTIKYLGGVRYDNVEAILDDPKTKDRYYLIVRASGTEPLVRIYTEGPTEPKCQAIEREVLATLGTLYAEGVRGCTSIYQLADMLVVTQPWKTVVDEVRHVVERLPALDGNSGAAALVQLLEMMLARTGIDEPLKIEWRNRKTVEAWIEILKGARPE